MAFKKCINFSDCPTIRLGGRDEATDKANPTQIEGYFLGSKDTPAKEYGPGRLHFFKTAEGNVGVWGKTMMNTALTSALIGQMVRVTFTGMGKKTKGRRPPYLYDVEHDEDNRLSFNEVAQLMVSNDQGAEPPQDDAEDSDDVQEDTLDDNEVETEQAPPRATPPKTVARGPSAAQQAKVAALLQGKRPSQA